MKENNSNILIKTMILVLTIGLSCLIFFGFMEGAKTALEYTAFGLVLFAELVLYISIVASGSSKRKLNSSDIISFGVIYFIANIITNLFCFKSITSLKYLLLINGVEMIIMMIIICIVMLKKK